MKTIDFKGKPYVTVSERVKAVRREFGKSVSIVTEITHLTDEYVIIKASLINSDGFIISTGYAKEQKGDSFINKGSHIENCETSAVGRCLAFAGYGIDAEIASVDEVMTADINHPAENGQLDLIESLLQSSTLDLRASERILNEMDKLSYSRANDCIEYLKNNQKDHIASGGNYDQSDINKKLDQMGI